MEGLLPLVYKSIKRSRTRRHYHSPSSSGDHFNHDYSGTQQQQYVEMTTTLPPAEKIHDDRKAVWPPLPLRRYNSINVDYLGRIPPENGGGGSRKLVRFRSHRLLSCVSGV